MRVRPNGQRTEPLAGIRALTLDFGNTLVPVDRAGLRRVVERTAEVVAAACGPFATEAFLAAWAEERDRQFAEALPQFREVDLRQRTVRVLARLRGMAEPAPTASWDDTAAATRSTSDEVDLAIDAYSRAFVVGLPAPTWMGPLLERLAARFPLAVLSNWPLASTIDRYIEAAGWSDRFVGVIVSERVGTIKPHPAIFAAARSALGDPPPTAIAHVGDDRAADVGGARAAGWRAVLVTGRPPDSPLPAGAAIEAAPPDLMVEDLRALEWHLP